MRNLKRALSLTLASVMLLGMMVLGTSAASYPDVTDEHNVEAIEVLQAIGVMTGSNSGNFNPDAKVSRIEMAIVMANLLDLDVNYFAGQNNFSDVPEWASGYVNACAANGIVTGVGGGRFGTGNVTATQAALMMLKALGYFQYNSDFGSDWARATANQAAKINLFDDLDVRDNTQLTRNQVAQLALNALESTMVDADDNTLHITTGADAGGIDITGGSVKYVVRSSSNTKVSQAINRDEKNSSAVTGLQGDTVELGEQLFQGDLRKEDAVGTADDFGRPGVKWTYKSETIGTYANSTSSVFTKRVNANDIYKVIGKSVTDDLKSGRYTLNNYVDGQSTTIAKGDIDNYSHRDNSTKVNGSGNGMVTEVYVNTQDRIVTIVSYNTFVFKAVNDYSESRGTITVTRAGDTDITLLSNNISDADFDLTDIKADDYLLITGVKGSSGRYDPQTLVKAEVVQGAVDSYKVNDSVTIAGNPYSYSLNTKKTGDSGAGSDPVKSTSYTVGQDAAVVLDKYGYIIAVDQAVVSSNYVFISEFAQPSGLSNGKIAASAFFTDGTSKDITVKEAYDYSDSAMTSSKSTLKDLPGNWYTYSVNSAEEYTLYRAENKYNIGTVSYTGVANPGKKVAFNNKVSFLLNDNNASTLADQKTANDKTIVLVNDKKNGDVMLYTGVANMPDLVLYTAATADVNLLFNKSSNYAYYVYIEVEGDSSVSNEDSNLLYILSYDGQHRITDNKSYYTYNVLDGVEKTTVESEYNNIVFKGGDNDGDVYRAVHKARTNSDKRITSVEAVVGSASNKLINGTGGTSITEDDGALTLSGGKYTMSNDAVITLILVGKDLDKNGVTAGPRMKDAKKDYEIMTVTAAELANLMKDYVLDYDYQGKVTDTNGTVISELYVTVFEATYNPSNVTKYTVNNSVNVRFSSAKNGTYAAGSSTTKFNEGSKVYVKAVSGWAIDAANTTAVELKSEGNGVYSFVIADDLAANAIKTVEDKGIKVSAAWNSSDNCYDVTLTYPVGVTVETPDAKAAITKFIEDKGLTVATATFSSPKWTFATKNAQGSPDENYVWDTTGAANVTATAGNQTELDAALSSAATEIEVTGDVTIPDSNAATGKKIKIGAGNVVTLTGTAKNNTYEGEGTVKVTGDSSSATINTNVILGNGGKVGATSKSVTVEKNAAATLVGNATGSVTVNEGAKVTLGSGVNSVPTFTNSSKGTVSVASGVGAASSGANDGERFDNLLASLGGNKIVLADGSKGQTGVKLNSTSVRIDPASEGKFTAFNDAQALKNEFAAGAQYGAIFGFKIENLPFCKVTAQSYMDGAWHNMAGVLNPDNGGFEINDHWLANTMLLSDKVTKVKFTIQPGTYAGSDSDGNGTGAFTPGDASLKYEIVCDVEW